MDGWSEGGDEQRSIARREERKIGFLIVVFEKPGFRSKRNRRDWKRMLPSPLAS